MYELARARGGRCLSTEYSNCHTKLQWGCSVGHIWYAVPSSVKIGCWCPDCGGRKRLTIEEMHNIARERGGKCLSKRYTNAKTKLKWQCFKKHQWMATSDTIKRPSWCPYCIGRHQTIKAMQKIARRKSGKCLSKKYINCETHLLWECKRGHQWKCTPSNIKRGKWCPYCYGNVKLSLKDMQKLAEAKNGKCLSTEYLNIDTKLKWQCSIGHIWETTPYVIKNVGTWCPHCSGNARLTIDEMHALARKNGGKCLAVSYKNSSLPLLWECKGGHQWKARASAIKLGSWCPTCSTLKREKMCRKIFEELFNKHFPKGRPTWLKNSRGNQMELDGYCEELNLAFEYQGEQHYKEHRFFHRRQSLKDRKESDGIKRKLCKKHGVFLIEIPYTLKNNYLEDHIFNNLKMRYEDGKHPQSVRL